MNTITILLFIIVATLVGGDVGFIASLGMAVLLGVLHYVAKVDIICPNCGKRIVRDKG